MDMANGFDFMQIWNAFSSIIFPLITCGICIYYVIANQNVDGFLMLGGASLHLLVSIFYSVILPIIVRTSGTDIYSSGVLVGAGLLSFFGSALFASGLIVLILKYVALVRKVNG